MGRAEPDPQWGRFHEHERWSLLNIEPPDHTRIRRLVAKVFTPSAVNALRPALSAFADEFLDHCTALNADQGGFDLIADYAQPYSVAVICSMLGVPRSDTQLLLDWSHAIVKMYELSTTMVLLEAGHEATVNTLGNGTRALMHHPDEWCRLTSGEVTAKTAVEEMLRWDSPLQLFERWVLEHDVSIAGQPLRVGEEVAMLFGAAERDPRRFTDPDRFDIGRGDTAHIGFGGGIHFCVGAPLARLELEVSMVGIAERFPNLELAAEPVYHPNFVIRGLTALQLSA